MQSGYSQPESEVPPEIDSEKTVIAVFSSERKAHEAGLAVLAAGGAYWVIPQDGDYALVVKTKDAIRLSNEVRIFRLKNRFWPRVAPELPERQISPLPTYSFLLFLILVFFLQRSNPNLEDLGMNNTVAFWSNAEWWRLFTAVTLHADAGHLVGNLFGMGLFGYFTTRYLGNGLGWVCILVSAALSNLTNNLIHIDSSFLSLGASTAVFGALGLVTGFPIGSYLKTRRQISKRQWIIPLSGGLMLLAWLGSGSAKTYVAGHLWGFLAGLGLGAILAGFELNARVNKQAQAGFLITAWFLIIGSWLFALKI